MDLVDGHVSPSCDIFSFGIVMWESWSQQKPWRSFSESSAVFNAVQKGIRPMIPSSLSAPEGYEDLMRLCWSQNPTDRPLVDVVMNSLQIVQSNYARDLIDNESLEKAISVNLEETEKKFEMGDNKIQKPDHNPWAIEMTSIDSKTSDVDVLSTHTPPPVMTPPQSPIMTLASKSKK